MKLIFTFFCCLFAFVGFAQIDFEDIDLGDAGYLNGSMNKGGFLINDVHFQNYYDTTYFYWTGYAISNQVNPANKGLAGQYDCIAGSGAKETTNFAISFGAKNYLKIPALVDQDLVLTSLSITNNNYAAFSMLEGDAFAKKFGGEDGNDADYFYVTIKAFKNSTILGDSINVFLADFRSSDNTKDYILNEWKDVDLKPLYSNSNLTADSLSFELHSSDVGNYGINTPAYFCLDEIQFEYRTDVQTSVVEANVAPNPFNNQFHINCTEATNVQIFNAQGQMIQDLGKVHAAKIDAATWVSGIYFVRLQQGTSTEVRKLMKQ